jgi:hypothetical protein
MNYKLGILRFVRVHGLFSEHNFGIPYSLFDIHDSGKYKPVRKGVTLFLELSY